MLHYEALQHLTHERQQQREQEAQAERLARAARDRGHRQGRRPSLTAGLEYLLTARRHGTQRRAGA
jgi:hypothetical protein